MLGRFFYDAGISLYTAAIHLAAWRSSKAKQWVNGRQDWRPRLRELLNTHKGQPLAWFHCASLGEFEQGRPVIEAFRIAFPEHKILLTFFSPSGYEIRKNYAGADYIFYLPADTRQNAEHWFLAVEPSVAFFVKYEFWHHYIQVLEENKVPVVSFSAIFRPSQIFFKPYGEFHRQILRRLNLIFVQNESSAKLLAGIGMERVRLGGDTRFDRVAVLPESAPEIQTAKLFKNNELLLIVGSAWPQDMDVILPVLNRLKAENISLKVIVAPHEIEAQNMKNWEQIYQGKSIRYSQVNEQVSVSEYDMLLIDNVGMLSALYRYADVAWIGGAYGKGLHNTLEAATFGMPIFFGNKNYTKFQEALDLTDEGVAMPVSDATRFESKLKTLLTDTATREAIAQKSRNYVKSKVGATAKVVHWYHDYLAEKK